MKILHINCNYITTALHQIMIEHLNNYNISNSIFVPTYSKKLSIINPNKNVIVSECFKKWDRLAFFYKQKKIYKSIVNSYDIPSFDAIHAYTLFTDGNVAYKLYKRYGIPYVVAIRSTDLDAFFKYRFYLRKRGIKIMRNAKIIFFLSDSYLNQVLQKYVPNKYVKEIKSKSLIVPNGIDDFWIKNIYKDKNIDLSLERFKNKKVNIIFVGQIVKRKNIELILKSISKLKDENWSVNFSAIGKIKDQRLFNKLSKDKNFNYLGEMNKQQLLEEFRKNDIFIMTSKSETFGLVYAEAMSQGLPVIYTKGQGFDQQFSEGVVGYHANIINAKDIVKSIHKICSNYKEISNNCVKLVDKFDWNIICRQYCEEYKKIIRKGKKHE